MTSPAGTVPGVTNVTGSSIKSHQMPSPPAGPAGSIIRWNGQRTTRVPSARPRGVWWAPVWFSPLAKGTGRLAVYRIVGSHIGVARRGLRAQVRKKIRADPALPSPVACLAFKKNHQPTRPVTGSTGRADQARAAIGTRIAGSSCTRWLHPLPHGPTCFSHAAHAECV